MWPHENAITFTPGQPIMSQTDPAASTIESLRTAARTVFTSPPTLSTVSRPFEFASLQLRVSVQAGLHNRCEYLSLSGPGEVHKHRYPQTFFYGLLVNEDRDMCGTPEGVCRSVEMAVMHSSGSGGFLHVAGELLQDLLPEYLKVPLLQYWDKADEEQKHLLKSTVASYVPVDLVQDMMEALYIRDKEEADAQAQRAAARCSVYRNELMQVVWCPENMHRWPPGSVDMDRFGVTV